MKNDEKEFLITKTKDRRMKWVMAHASVADRSEEIKSATKKSQPSHAKRRKVGTAGSKGKKAVKKDTSNMSLTPTKLYYKHTGEMASVCLALTEGEAMELGMKTKLIKRIAGMLAKM